MWLSLKITISYSDVKITATIFFSHCQDSESEFRTPSENDPQSAAFRNRNRRNYISLDRRSSTVTARRVTAARIPTECSRCTMSRVPRISSRPARGSSPQLAEGSVGVCRTVSRYPFENVSNILCTLLDILRGIFAPIVGDSWSDEQAAGYGTSHDSLSSTKFVTLFNDPAILFIYSNFFFFYYYSTKRKVLRPAKISETGVCKLDVGSVFFSPVLSPSWLLPSRRQTNRNISGTVCFFSSHRVLAYLRVRATRMKLRGERKRKIARLSSFD